MRALLFMLLCASAYGQAFTMFDPAFVSQRRTVTSLTVPTVGLAASNNSASATSLTITGFTVSGSNPYLLVFTAGSASIIARTLSTATANGVSMLPALFSTNFTAHGNAYICGLANPASGDIVVTYSGANNAGMSVFAVLLNGTATTGAVDGSFSSSGRTSVSATLSSVATDMVIDCLFGGLWTQGGSQTLIGAMNSGSTPAIVNTSKQTGGASSTTMSWSGGNATVSHVAIVMHGM